MDDANTGGGVIDSIPQGTVYANNKLVSIDGSSVTGHAVVHPPTVTANGSLTVFIGGIPVNRFGDADACGHSRAEGSPTVYVGDSGAPTGALTAGGAGAAAAGVSSTAASTVSSNDGPWVQQAKRIASKITPAAAMTVSSNIQMVIKGFAKVDGTFPPNGLYEIPFINSIPDVQKPISNNITPINEATALTISQSYSDTIDRLMEKKGLKVPPTTRLPFYGDTNV